jgi:hypothetical protein
MARTETRGTTTANFLGVENLLSTKNLKFVNEKRSNYFNEICRKFYS